MLLQGCLEAEYPPTLCKQIKFTQVTTAWLRCAGGREESQPSNFVLLEILLLQSSIWFSFGGCAQFISAGASLLIQLSYRCRRGEGSKQDWCKFAFFVAFFFAYLPLASLLSKIKRGQNKTLYIMKDRQREKWQRTKLFSVFF